MLSLNGEKIKEFLVNIFQVIVRLFLSYEFFKSYLRGSDNLGKQSRYYFSYLKAIPARNGRKKFLTSLSNLGATPARHGYKKFLKSLSYLRATPTRHG